MEVCGFSKVFEKFCEINPSTDGFVHDIGKVRDKYTEILEAVGITVSLLRTAEKTVSSDGETIKGGSYIFPVDAVDFCAEVINRYTSKDFKRLRSANFRDMSLGETQFLVDGFSKMVRNLGYSHEVVLREYRIMERRLHYKLQLSEKALEDQLQGVREQAIKYQNATFTKGTVEFRLFQFDAPADGKLNGLHAGQLKAYIQLCLALSQMAKEVRTASPKPQQNENPKYAMRTWLLRLGFIGEEFATAREVLTKRLAGDASFRHGRPPLFSMWLRIWFECVRHSISGARYWHRRNGSSTHPRTASTRCFRQKPIPSTASTSTALCSMSCIHSRTGSCLML